MLYFMFVQEGFFFVPTIFIIFPFHLDPIKIWQKDDLSTFYKIYKFNIMMSQTSFFCLILQDF